MCVCVNQTGDPRFLLSSRRNTRFKYTKRPNIILNAQLNPAREKGNVQGARIKEGTETTVAEYELIQWLEELNAVGKEFQ